MTTVIRPVLRCGGCGTRLWPWLRKSYLKLAEAVQSTAPKPVPLKACVEKPVAVTAAAMLADGRDLWSAGIFLFTLRTMIEAFQTHAPDILAKVQAAVDDATCAIRFTRLASQPWTSLPDTLIDDAVIEKADNLSVQPDLGIWSDLGGWDAFWRKSGPDAAGVVAHRYSTAIDCTDTLLRSASDGLQIVGIGLTNIIAVAMPDAVLIADKDRVQDVWLAVAALKKAGARQAETFPPDHRPWG